MNSRANSGGACAECVKRPEAGGGCTGYARGGLLMPLCHVDERGRMECPTIIDRDGRVCLAAGQERFWRRGLGTAPTGDRTVGNQEPAAEAAA